MLRFDNIDTGKAFDWGKTSLDYAKYRDIYPNEFYQRLISLGLCTKGQNVLDLATGTGVIPRNMYHFGAKFTGVDISENQIEQAKILSNIASMDIDYIVSPAEDIDFPNNAFDVVMACQCFWYFDINKIAPFVNRVLNKNGKFAITYFNWIPSECEIAQKSEELVLKYNPYWSGCNYKRPNLETPEWCAEFFTVAEHITFDLAVPFTKESWNGRMKACRGIGASLLESEIASFSDEHIKLLDSIAPDRFDILHIAEILILEPIK